MNKLVEEGRTTKRNIVSKTYSKCLACFVHFRSLLFGSHQDIAAPIHTSELFTTVYGKTSCTLFLQFLKQNATYFTRAAFPFEHFMLSLEHNMLWSMGIIYKHQRTSYLIFSDFTKRVLDRQKREIF
jgi:hypothetical protein